MKKAITQTSFIKMILLLFGALLFHFQTYAQVQPTKLTWDGEVGCRIYEEDKERGLSEDIDSDECIRVCERSRVTYTVSGTNLVTATWSVTGGIVTPNGNGLSANVEWSSMGGGSIEVTVVKQDNSTQVIQNCVEIIASPIAEFQISNSKEPVSCLNTELNFINLSTTNGGTALVSYQWDFGDNTYSNEFQPTHTYTSPGNYKVILSVTNECNCTDTYAIEIEVIDRPNVTIECPTVVCDGFSATYSVRDECGGKWKVDGGTIVNDNGHAIEVLWDQVNESGFGYVSYLSDCTCPVWTTVKVPVIQSVGTIKGLPTICNNAQARYTLPQWPTTDFQWEIVPISGGYGTTIINTDQRNEVVVNALEAGTYLLRCVYKNTLLGCGGVAEFEIEVTDPVITWTKTDNLICQGIEGHFNSDNSNAVWTLKKGTNVVTTFNGQNFDHIFDVPGAYVLTAIAPNYCESEPIFITVAETPTPVQEPIEGPTEACLKTSFVFSAVNDDPAKYILEWNITGGIFDGSNIGDSVSVQFNTLGTQTISVIKRLKNAPFCKSDEISLQVQVKTLDATIANVQGLNQFCASSITQFIANVSFTEYDHVEWQFLDSNSIESSIGNIISGQYTLSPVVSFNQTSNTAATSSGFLMLTVRKCTETKTVKFPFTVINNIDFWIVDAPVQVCGSTDFTITIETSIPVNHAVFDIVYSDGSHPGAQFIYSGSYTNTIDIDLEYFANVVDEVGRSVTITGATVGGCTNNNMVVHNLMVLPAPVVHITSHKLIVVCDPSNFSHTVTANMQMNLTDTTLAWYYGDNTLIPGSTGMQTITITNIDGLGEYYVEATAENGCKARDYFKFVNENCNPNCQSHNNSIIITNSQWLDCTRFKITANFTGSPTIGWNYNPQYVTFDIASQNISGSVVTAEFTTNVAGIHDVSAIAQYGGNYCDKFDTVSMDKKYTPDIRFSAVCNMNTNNYTVTLWDNSTYIGTPPSFTLTLSGNYGSSSDSPFEIPNVAPGIYTATVTLNGAIICTKEIVVDLPQLPSINDEIDFEQNGISISETCDTEAVTLIPPISNSNFIYIWDFNDVTNSSMSPTVNLRYSDEVKLTIKTKEGCEYHYSKEIRVNRNNNDGKIDGGGSYCETDIVTLEYSAIGSSNVASYQWMRFNNPITGATNSTYTPDESGSYWVVTYTADDCANYKTPAVNVTLIKAPYVYIQGPDGACKGVPFTLNGVSENEGFPRRWLRNNSPLTTWNTTTPFDRQFTEQTPGTYTYTLEVRNPLYPNCVGSYTHTVVVSNPPSVPSLSHQILSCSPYRVRLTATGNASQYIWSNGMTGASIEVTEGGPYKVTASNGVGCEVSNQFDVPKSPDGYLWIFPTGCYSYCGEKIDTDRVILGPSPYAQFNSYRWLENGSTIAGGSGAVSELSYMLNGTYQLMLSNGNCDATSGELRANYNGRCGRCQLEVNHEIEKIIYDPFLVYQYHVDIYNPNGEGINISLESTMGTFSPSSFYIPANGSTGGITLYFYPNANFVPGMLEVKFNIQGTESLQCKYSEMWDVPSARPAVTNPQDSEANGNPQLINLVVAPNPVKETTTISYELDTKEQTNVQLVVYNMMGVQMWVHDSSESSESVVFDASRLSSGQYIIILRVNNEFIKQQILIKN
ncbi:PKD domain-containing protein [Flavobacterium sp. I3-2]|uniref:PKD domain-containing protein n=1 Tax=Flavobacterium sp. I3-2 TaxID=2748319 RepID=UPI0015ACE410|nr:PKD domain-containing protein [Flavobacterium sp. I3-2]